MLVFIFWFKETYLVLIISLSTKATIVLNFCLIGKIPNDFPILKCIELARKTFKGIQVRVSTECALFQNHKKKTTQSVELLVMVVVAKLQFQLVLQVMPFLMIMFQLFLTILQKIWW